LLGDPGSGKTTTLWRLCYDYATAAQQDPQKPLPVLVNLGGYAGSGPFYVYVGHHLDPLAPYLETYRAAGRLILLLDGLNEMPQAGYKERVGRIRKVLDRWPEEMVVVTCRALDYAALSGTGEKLGRLQKVEVSPLDEARIRTFLHNYLGEVAGERLFWAMAGGEEVRALWQTWRRAGGTWMEFWTAEKMPETVYSETSGAQDRLWARLRREPPALLALGQNPYLLLMTAQVYVRSEERLPANRAHLFADFVDTLLAREEERHPERWLPAEDQLAALAALAYAMQVEGGRGTTVERVWAADQLRRAVTAFGAERLLYLATSATLLDADDATVRFYHQLLQEFFAARELGRRVTAGEAMTRYWPGGRWWEPSGWEETAILLAGMEPDATGLLEKLVNANPVVAARCLAEGDARVDQGTRASIVSVLIDSMAGDNLPAVARAQAGDLLARLGDPRPGVGLREDGLPDIAWCKVPAGPFLMGSDKDGDPQALDREYPQQEVVVSGFAISKYPVTVAQYAAFVEAGGYGERRYWIGAGWQWKGERSGPETYGGVYSLSNHPVVGVSWYEAVAFCRWLTERLRHTGALGPEKEVRLPAEAEWEKAARGTEGRIYPWGDEFDPEKCNMAETGIGATSAVGIFPGGVLPYEVQELSGNVWEWCATKWRDSYGEPADESPEGYAPRVLRGGSFRDNQGRVRCASRLGGYPLDRYWDLGIRCVVAPVASER
jgi:formylglycine-generating enzyme required for sulfatase activity